MLTYRKGELFWSGVSLHEIARKWGTPAYVYNKSVLAEDFNRIKNSFTPITDTILYALKANANPELVQIIAGMGAGADLVSMGELLVALKCGIPNEKMVFTGVGKTDEEISCAIKSHLLAINVESEQELKEIETVAEVSAQKQPVLLRTNPDIDSGGHPYISTGLSVHKFGIDIGEIEKLAQYCFRSKSLNFLGLHIHIGSQIEKPEPIERSIAAVAGLIERIERRRIPVPIIDIGGGMPVNYAETASRLIGEEPPVRENSIEEVTNTWVSAVQRQFDCTQYRILIEPGRAITARCGMLLTKILYRKRRAHKEFVVVDAGMNDFIRPALYGAIHGIVPLQEPGNQRITADVVGPICETGDFFMRDCVMPECERGAYLAILDTGAYGFVAASNYNTRCRPPELLIDNGEVRCIRPRERYRNII